METIKLKEITVEAAYALASEGGPDGTDINGYDWVEGGRLWAGEEPISAWEGQEEMLFSIQKIWNENREGKPIEPLPYGIEVETDVLEVKADHPVYEQLPDDSDEWFALLHVNDDGIITGVTLWA